MASSELEQLLSAVHAAPGNAALVRTVARACLDEADADSLLELLAIDDAAAKLEAAQLLLAARLLLGHGERATAASLYRQAIAANPTLEDPGLQAELSGK